MTTTGEERHSCSDCIYWTMARPNEGWCRRHAPSSSSAPDAIAHWPQSHGDQWCGEFMPVGAQPGPGIPCALCRFWRHSADGLQPVDRGDRVAAWWAQAGLCRRRAPQPRSEPGPRAYWPATHSADGCGDGEVAAHTNGA